MRDPLGVLSIYVDADPVRASGPRPGWELRLRRELRFLEERLGWAGRHDRAKALRVRLTELESELVHLFHPSAPGRGRALFVPLSGGEAQRFALQLPLPDLVRLDDTAHMLPLLDAFEAGRPAGVIGVSRTGLRVLDVRLGVAEDALWLDFEANPRFMRQAARHLKELAHERGWDLVLLRGDARLVEPLRMQLLAGDRSFEVETGAESLEWRSEYEIAAAVRPDLARARRRRDWALVGQVREGALSGKAAALGLDDTLRALADNRVSCLLLGGADDRLAEQMIEHALESGARVTPLAPEAAAALKPHEGVAALLRW